MLQWLAHWQRPERGTSRGRPWVPRVGISLYLLLQALRTWAPELAWQEVALAWPGNEDSLKSVRGHFCQHRLDSSELQGY